MRLEKLGSLLAAQDSGTVSKEGQTVGDDEDAEDSEPNAGVPFQPYSMESVFGADNIDQCMEHFLQRDFHARLIKELDSDLVYYPSLDQYLQAKIKNEVCSGLELQELDQ